MSRRSTAYTTFRDLALPLMTLLTIVRVTPAADATCSWVIRARLSRRLSWGRVLVTVSSPFLA